MDNKAINILPLELHKTCTMCGVSKNRKEFYARRDQCKPCMRQDQAARKKAERLENPERLRLRERKYYLQKNAQANASKIADIEKALKGMLDKRTLKKGWATKEHILRRSKNNNYRSRYGITLVEAERMLQSQMGLCANRACGESIALHKTSGEKMATANIDHCHATNEIRGILCRNCNLALGVLDNKNLVLGLTEYLNKFDIKKGESDV